MAFTEQQLQMSADLLGCDLPSIKAVARVESSGTTLWYIDGKWVPPVRLEAAWFGRFTGYVYNASYPQISSTYWDPSLAATTQEGAYAQLAQARSLNVEAADQSCSWGAFQIMGFHWMTLGYENVEAMVRDMQGEGGQLSAFCRFIKSDPVIHMALREHDWFTFERGYNGGGQHGAYAAAIQSAYDFYVQDTVPTLPRLLKLGSRGADVVELQKQLYVEPDGDFGPITHRAVVDFQRAHGLTPDGIVGPRTRAALEAQPATIAAPYVRPSADWQPERGPAYQPEPRDLQ